MNNNLSLVKRVGGSGCSPFTVKYIEGSVAHVEKAEKWGKLKFPLAALGKLNHNYKLILSGV